MRAEIMFDVPVILRGHVTPEEIQEWLEFCLGYTGNISRDNPLKEYEFEADRVDLI